MVWFYKTLRIKEIGFGCGFAFSNLMRVAIHEKAYFTLFAFSGDLDNKAFFELRRLCNSLLKREIKEYIFDFTQVGAFSNQAISLVRNFEARLGREGGRLVFLYHRDQGVEQMHVLFGRHVTCFGNEMDLEDFIITDTRPFERDFLANGFAA